MGLALASTSQIESVVSLVKAHCIGVSLAVFTRPLVKPNGMQEAY